MHVFILAGGYATRLWPLTEHRAKPLLPLAGKPLLTHIVESLPKDLPVTVSTNATLEDMFLLWKHTIDHPKMDILIEKTKNDDDKLGALGATAQWIERKKIEDDILVLTGDNYFGFSFELFFEETKAGHPTIAAFDIEDRLRASRFGVVTIDAKSKQVLSFEEKPDHPRSTLVSTGCFYIPRQFLNVVLEYAEKKPDDIGGIFEEFLRRGIHTHCFTFHDPWFDIGSFEAYLEATRLLVGPEPLIDPTATVERVSIEGSVVIGPGCRVTGGMLHDTVLFENCVLEDCVLRECILDDGCRLSRLDLSRQMVRSNTVLEGPKEAA